jgi:glycosyltransferase involved in cell wall biosynthesis
VTWHNAVLEESGPRRRLLTAGERFVAKSADIALCASADLEDRVRALGGRDVRPGPVGLQLPEAARSLTEVRADLGVDGAPLLLSVGRLHPQKAHHVFIRAVARLRSSRPDVRAVIAGDGPLRAELDELIAELNAPVTLLGRRSDVSDLLRAADVVVCTSVWEARALAVQEALLAGRPVVATRVGGLPGLVGDAGVLVPAADIEALAGSLEKIVSDESWAATLAARSAEAGRRLPTEHDTVVQVEAVYGELLGASR